jgi:hypothetical protein
MPPMFADIKSLEGKMKRKRFGQRVFVRVENRPRMDDSPTTSFLTLPARRSLAPKRSRDVNLPITPFYGMAYDPRELCRLSRIL